MMVHMNIWLGSLCVSSSLALGVACRAAVYVVAYVSGFYLFLSLCLFGCCLAGSLLLLGGFDDLATGGGQWCQGLA